MSVMCVRCMHTRVQVSTPVCVQRLEEDTGSLICQSLYYLTELGAKLTASTLQ